MTKVGVTNKEYGFKRIDTLLRKWNAKAIKKGVQRGSASFIGVSRKVSQ